VDGFAIVVSCHFKFIIDHYQVHRISGLSKQETGKTFQGHME